MGQPVERVNSDGGKLPVDHRIVDDFPGQINLSVVEPTPCLVSQLKGIVHAVAEAKLTRQVEGEAAGPAGVILLTNGFDNRAAEVVRDSLTGAGLDE